MVQIELLGGIWEGRGPVSPKWCGTIQKKRIYKMATISLKNRHNCPV